MKKIILIGLFTALALGSTYASEYNGSIDSSNGISNNGLEVALPCSPSSVSNGSVSATTCVITCNSNYTLSSSQCVANSAGGGGGGGSPSKDVCPDADLSTSFYDGFCDAPKTVIKKLGGEVVGVTTTIGNITNSPYSTELNTAYLFAFENGITTMDTIQKANMDGELIRSHMAKIMVNYAIKVLEKTPDTGAVCEFNDIANQTSEMRFYIKLACQLGIMGINSSLFNPNGIVTRAEFGTVLSRSLYGNLYDGGTPYYKNHLAALKATSIISNATPDLKELRGYVMLMLQRVAK